MTQKDPLFFSLRKNFSHNFYSPLASTNALHGRTSCMRWKKERRQFWVVHNTNTFLESPEFNCCFWPGPCGGLSFRVPTVDELFLSAILGFAGQPVRGPSPGSTPDIQGWYSLLKKGLIQSLLWVVMLHLWTISNKSVLLFVSSWYLSRDLLLYISI